MSILNLSFNQQASHLSCCTEHGDIIYSLDPALEKQFDNKRGGGVGLVELYGKTNIYFLTGGGANPFSSRDIVIMYDEKKKKNIYEINMNDAVRNIRIAGTKLVVVLEKQLTIFDFNLESGISVMGTKITYANPSGICAINKINNENLVIASLGSKKGEVAVWKPETNTYHVIEAHKNNIEALAINNDGTLIATASETGTLIKVFSTESYKLQFEFRRGSTTAKVYDLAFNNDSSILACCSGSGTVHLFELYNDVNDTKNTKSYLSGLKDYLPAYFSSHWGFKQIPVKTTSRMICSFDSGDRLHVASWDGNYFKIDGKDYSNVTNGFIDINSA